MQYTGEVKLHVVERDLRVPSSTWSALGSVNPGS